MLSELRQKKWWEIKSGILLDTETYVHVTNSSKGHVISSGTMIGKDKTIIEKYTLFYAFTKTDDGWKMYANSDVILD